MRKSILVLILISALFAGYSTLAVPINCDLQAGICTQEYTDCVNNGNSGVVCAKAYNGCMKLCQDPLPILEE